MKILEIQREEGKKAIIGLPKIEKKIFKVKQ